MFYLIDFKRHLLRHLLSGVLFLTSHTFVQAQYADIVFFGDSLSDVGNLDNSTFGIQPGDEYFEGRFSNGPVYSELLTEKLGLGVLKPSSEGGTNYAYGGARTSGTTFFEGGSFLDDLDEQVDRFLEKHQPSADILYVVWAGSNDFILGDATNSLGRAKRVVAQIDRLVQAGAANLLSINLPLLGETPAGNGSVALNQRATDFNLALQAELTTITNADPQLELFQLHVEDLFTALLEQPDLFGFLNTTDQGRLATDAGGLRILGWQPSDVPGTRLDRRGSSSSAAKAAGIRRRLGFGRTVDRR